MKKPRTRSIDIARFVDYAAGFQSQVCLRWPFGRNSAGYGHFTLGGKFVLAHRIVCERTHGAAPENKPEAAHLCGNGHEGCVNPHHLAWKSRKENAADMKIHGTSPEGEKMWMARLSVDAVRYIRLNKDRLSMAEMADHLGVSRGVVRHVIVGNSWRWVDEAAA